MSEHFPTSDLALPYHAIPRIDEQFVVNPESHVDILLPGTINDRARLRLHDINDRWIQAIDLSAYRGYAPEGEALMQAPHGAFDDFELGEEFVIGRDHNPDNLPCLDSLTVSREHLRITVSLGEHGIVLAIKDLGSRNGTEIVMNDTLTRCTQPVEELTLSR